MGVGAHKDPITAQGITDAFRDAVLLTDAIHAGYSGAEPLTQAMAGYEAKRNHALKPIYDFIVDHAAMEPFDDTFQDVLASLRTDPTSLSQFFGVIQNTVHWDDFFTPTNLAHILGLNIEEELARAS